MDKTKLSKNFHIVNIVFSVITYIILSGWVLVCLSGTKDDQITFLLLSFAAFILLNPVSLIFGILSLCFDKNTKTARKIIFIAATIIAEIILLWPCSYIGIF